eukprot:NODE_6_length_70510_cov_1.054395.p35 type:complete len:264 gc:universal NODE_6_length_70510_cov_1.054395:67101-67892(+)
MVNMKHLSLVTLVVQNSMLVLILRYSRIASDYLSTTAVLMCEVLKLLICFGIYLNEADEVGTPKTPLAKLQDIAHPKHQSWKLAIPACLYAIQNNLQYVAASNLSAASFQVIYQLKILTTALCSVWLLNRKLSMQKWIALIILTVGVACVQYKGDSTNNEKGNSTIGFMAVLTACMLSGLAGVYFEKVLKTTKTSLWVRNIQLSAWSLIPASFGCIFVDGAAIKNEGFFVNYTHWTIWAILCQALGGLIVALVVKVYIIYLVR